MAARCFWIIMGLTTVNASVSFEQNPIDTEEEKEIKQVLLRQVSRRLFFKKQLIYGTQAKGDIAGAAEINARNDVQKKSKSSKTQKIAPREAQLMDRDTVKRMATRSKKRSSLSTCVLVGAGPSIGTVRGTDLGAYQPMQTMRRILDESCAQSGTS